MLEQTRILRYPLPGGNGLAAEDANNLNDKLRGKIAEVIGISNELNGPDRIVNGMFLQSKYYQSASKTVAAAFDSNTQKDQSIFLRVEFEYLFKEIVRKRPKVSFPSVEQLERAVDEICLEST